MLTLDANTLVVLGFIFALLMLTIQAWQTNRGLSILARTTETALETVQAIAADPQRVTLLRGQYEAASPGRKLVVDTAAKVVDVADNLTDTLLPGSKLDQLDDVADDLLDQIRGTPDADDIDQQR